MKSALMTLVLFASFAAQAKTIDLGNDRAIFKAASAAFPTAVEQVGTGFTKELYVKSIACMSNQDEDECTITPFEGQSVRLHSDDNEAAQAKLTNLINALKKGGVKPTVAHKELDGIGVATFTLNNFDCARIEPKASSPRKPVKPQYSCSYEK